VPAAKAAHRLVPCTAQQCAARLDYLLLLSLRDEPP